MTYYRVHFACQDIGQVFKLETLRKRLDKLDHHRHFLTAVKLLLRVQAVVACSAVLGSICFSEIVEQQLSAA
jgi:hypothetical protein